MSGKMGDKGHFKWEVNCIRKKIGGKIECDKLVKYSRTDLVGGNITPGSSPIKGLSTT